MVRADLIETFSGVTSVKKQRNCVSRVLFSLRRFLAIFQFDLRGKIYSWSKWSKQNGLGNSLTISLSSVCSNFPWKYFISIPSSQGEVLGKKFHKGIFISYISRINYAIRSSLYLLLLILDNIVSSDRVSFSSEVSQYVIYIFIIYILTYKNIIYILYVKFN